MTPTRLAIPPWIRHAVALAAVATLAACGDDGVPQLAGVAAVGSPIVGGTVEVSCAAGPALSTTTGAAGAWQIAAADQTLPCAVRVSGGTVDGNPNPGSYHALALAFDGNLNLTPLSDLVTARAVGAAPQAWFAAPTFDAVTAANVDAAVDAVVAALGVGGALGTIDPLTTSFQPQPGDPLDDLLEALRSALAALAIDYPTLLAAAASGDFAALGALPAAITAALGSSAGNGGGGPSSGGPSSGGSSGNCASGVAMSYHQYAAGGSYTDGQRVCASATDTSFTVDGKTLGNGVKSTVVTAPFAAWTYADGAYSWEVVLKNGAMYEVNLMQGTKFLGQLEPQ